MIEEALTRHPGVYRRKDSGIYQFGLRVPKDLLPLYETSWAVRCSLETPDLREANERAKAMQAKWSATFAQQRGQSAPPEPSLVIDLHGLRTRLLQQLENALSKADVLYSQKTPEWRQEAIESWRWQRDEMRDGLASGYVPDWHEDDLQKRLEKLGLPRTPLVEQELMGAFVAYAEGAIEALTDSTRSFPRRAEILSARRALVAQSQVATSGRAIPPIETRASGQPSRTIDDALQQWKKKRTRPEKTVGTYTRHAGMFKEMMGDPPLSAWDRALGRAFRDRLTEWARANRKTARTADNILVGIRSISKAAEEEEWVAGNPFGGLVITEGGKDSEGREPWTHGEVAILFDDPIWSEKSLPVEAKAGAEASYWMPLIACYTGARLSEIAQLWTDDVDIEQGAECFEFRANKVRRQGLKNKASWRAVPMHSELVRLGLPAYVDSLPSGPLFPSLPTGGRNGPGGMFGGWFGKFKARKGFARPDKTFHSFRHLVSTELQIKNVSEALRNSVLGHTGEGMGEKVYGATIRRNAQALRPFVELLDYPIRSLAAFDWS